MLKSAIYEQALCTAIKDLPIENLQKKKILITGATGMLCSCVVDMLIEIQRRASVDMQIIAAGRSTGKLQDRFSDARFRTDLKFWEFDATQPPPEEVQADFILHGASIADPVNLAQYPVETMLANIYGTKNLLDMGLKCGMQRFLYISSGEFYGQPDNEMSDFIESYSGPINYSAARACYPSAKRASEALCQSYISEYKADCVIVRPCHLFGPTMLRSDSRAVSEFLWSAFDNKNIVLKSSGLMERSHCYVLDAAKAILWVLLFGTCGEAYNIADRAYQMTIRSFAEAVAQAGNCKVLFENPSDIEARGYSHVTRAVLSSRKLEQLGWAPSDTEFSKIVETLMILKENQAGGSYT